MCNVMLYAQALAVLLRSAQVQIRTHLLQMHGQAVPL